ncbi:MAG: HAD family hydrolase [Candidatus Limnocylindrales bacterium]|jgi:FMN phosphatase YigB (HAD superfamily)
MTDREERRRGMEVVALGQSIEAITLDFGNTLLPFPSASMGGVLSETAERAAATWGFAADEFARVWGEERLRQLAEEVPQGREANMDVRAARVLARLRGHPAPAAQDRWDDAQAARRSTPDEVGAILDSYASAFVRLTPVPPEISPLLESLASRYALAILSNWPIAVAVERYVEAAGWSAHLSAVVISQRVGAIKPRPEIFRAAARALKVASGPRLLHVGDDLGADVAGAHGVGWRAAWVRIRPEDSPLPVAPSSGSERPDIVVDRVTDLSRALGLRTRRYS